MGSEQTFQRSGAGRRAWWGLGADPVCLLDRLRQASVHPQVLPGDVARGIRAEEGYHVGQLGHARVAADGDARPALGLFRQTVDETGQHVVDADTVACVFRRDELGETGKSCAKDR